MNSTLGRKGGESLFFFCGQTGGKIHIVHHPRLGEKSRDNGLEPTAGQESNVKKEVLVVTDEAQPGIFGHHIMQVGSPASPVAQNKDRGLFFNGYPVDLTIVEPSL